MTKLTGAYPAYLYGALEAKVEKYAKKAQRLGLPAPILTKVGETIEERVKVNFFGEYKKVPVTMVHWEIDGEIPKIEGWTFLGAIEHFTGDDGTPQMLFKKPFLIEREMANLEQYLHPKCEHCNTTRARAKTVLLENEAGEIKQVGKACLTNFIGGDWAVWEDDDDGTEVEDEYGFLTAKKTAAGLDILMATAATIRLCGWISKSAAQGTNTEPTADKVSAWVFVGKAPKTDAEITAEDIAKAQTVMEWVKGLEPDSNYLANLKAVLTTLWVHQKNIGLVASAVAAYDLQQTRDREAAERAALEAAANADREECPEGKIKIEGVVLKATVHENDYGTRLVITVLDDRGFKVWGTNPKGNFGVGDRLTFLAEVEQARDDKFFGYFKRPSKVTLVASATAAA